MTTEEPHGGVSRRGRVVAIAIAALATALMDTAGAQDDPASTTTSPTTLVVAPTSTPATPPSVEATTTTSLVEPSVTTTLPPLADEAGTEFGPTGQGAFDPQSRQLLLGALAEAQSRVRQLQHAIAKELRTQAPLRAERDRLAGGSDQLGESEAANAAGAAAAREDLRQQVVAAYVRSDRRLSLLATWNDAESVSRGEAFLAALRSERRDALAELAERSSGLSTLGSHVASQLAPVETAIADSDRRLGYLQLATGRGLQEIAAYLAGSHVFVPGFRFPVLGPVSFIDSWGFPRMPGTAYAHWHEGTDVMAPAGRELIAVEDGVISKVGEAGLGGQRVWLLGSSGTSYYYAHLSSFGPGISEGTPVSAGQVIGYVGTTGNASGGAPHLHFEIHPGGGPSVNPYPLLITTWGAEPMPSEAEALAGPGPILPLGTAFAPDPG